MYRFRLARELGCTVAELGVRMTHRELVEQRLYDMLTMERRQEEALDHKLVADNHRAMERLKAGR